VSLTDLFKEVLLSLTANKVRSGLTILGIVVGIASVILMVSIGQGSQASITSSITSSGANLITVSPGASSGGGFGGGPRGAAGSAQTLTKADATALESLSGVKAVAPEITRNFQVIAGSKNTNTRIVGTTANDATVRSITTSTGTFISDQDVKSTAAVAVLGPTAASDLFGDGVDVIGKSVRINGIPFRVIGTTASKGGGGFGNQDDVIYVPITTAQRQLAGNTQYVSSIYVEAASADQMPAVKAAITTELLSRHHISDSTQADFSTLSQADILSTASTITGTFTLLLAAIAGISLVVGGIGIMNMMLTTVTERMREIGLRKALGARRADISTQFLAEAVALTVIGGVVGIVIGWGGSLLVTALFSIATDVSWLAVVIAVAVCTAIGVVFGYYPAYRAARLDPIESLRYQ
jgi:putative ABC transport system permease protein